MVMTVRMAPPLPLILLLMIEGVYSADDGWNVTCSPSHICALNGSTVTINCNYTYPTGHQITEVFWTNTAVPGKDSPDLSEDSEYKQRIQYLGDKQHDCSVRLTDVSHKYSHKYYFRFITDKNKWTGKEGVTLAVTDLQVESEGETVMEGHSVTLTCESTCSLTDTSTFIWFRNTHTLNERKKKLILPSVRRENAGDYSCAVQGHKLTSPPRRLHVIYPPDKPVISISSSGVIVEGDSVNLTCSSESNPPVHIYSWFKENQTSSVGSGQTFSITNINSRLSGWFYCVAQNEVGSQRSAAVSLTVKGGNNRIVYMVAGVAAACGLIFILIVVFVWKRKRRPDDIRHKQDDIYSTVTKRVSETESRDPEEIQYATVHHLRVKDMKTSEETEDAYETSGVHQHDAAERSDVQMMEDQSVIYSTVKCK